MQSFFQWVEDNGLDLPVVDVEKGKKVTNEDGVRTGYSQNYPDAYIRSQYPDAYFPPAKSTAFLDKVAQAKKAKDTAAN